MSSSRGILGFIAGALVGAAAGVVAGILVAPRPGTQTRSMAAEAATDAWGNVVDAYHQGAADVASRATAACEDVAGSSDELREKVASARARMEQIRASLAQAGQRAVERAEVEIVDPLVERVEAAAGDDGAQSA